MGPTVHDPDAPSERPAPGGASAGNSSAPSTPTEAMRDVTPRLKELGEYVSYLVATKVDAAKVAVRNAGIYAALGVVGLLAAGSLVVTAVVLLCLGVARGLTALCGGRAWAGDLLAALLFFGLLGAGAWIGIRKVTSSSRQRTLGKYASRQKQQRASFGTDVAQRANDARK